MEHQTGRFCPECHENLAEAAQEHLTRREFFKVAGGAVVAASAGVIASATPAYTAPRLPLGAKAALPSAKAPVSGTPESLVKTLYNTLTDAQKRTIALPWSDPRRLKVDANWEIVKPSIAETFNPEQQEIVRAIFKYPKLGPISEFVKAINVNVKDAKTVTIKSAVDAKQVEESLK